MNKEIINKNMKDIIESEYFYQIYTKLKDYNDIENQMGKSAFIFNTIYIISQLFDNIDNIKNVCNEFFKDCPEGQNKLESYHINLYLKNILENYDINYKENTLEKMANKLCHGFSVHFTTPKIIEEIEKDDGLKAYNSFITKEEEKILYKAIEKQRSLNSEEENNQMKFLFPGFGMSKGISMSSQTNGFWMNKTPESLLFLFGSNIEYDNYEKAMDHIKNNINHLDLEEQKEVLEICSKIFNKTINEDNRRAAVLIDRDQLVYDKVTYWNENPPRTEEIRPYRNNNIDSIYYEEESKYCLDIPTSALSYIYVPSVKMLEKYKELHQDICGELNNHLSLEDLDSCTLDFDDFDEFDNSISNIKL